MKTRLTTTNTRRHTMHNVRWLSLLMLALVMALSTSIVWGQTFFLEPFNANPTLSAVQAPNTWYVDRFAPRAFEMASFDGGNRLRHGISTLDAALSRPGGQQGTFYNTQGRKFDLNNPVNTYITADLYIGTDWQTNHRRADMWATMSDGTSITAYPIIGFANTTGSLPTWRVYNVLTGDWINLPDPAGFTYGAWYTLKTELTASALKYYINGVLVYTGPTNGSTTFKNIIIQAYNFGDPTLGPSLYALESYDVYWDNIGAGSNIQNITQATHYATIQAAVNAANPSDVISVGAGTYVVPSQINFNKTDLTLKGAGSALTIVQVSGTGERFFISASGTTIKDMTIEKTDKTGVQNIIYIGANNTTIRDNIIRGQFIIGDGDVSRAMVVTGGLTGLQIEGNTFYGLRQPAYFSGLTTGNISNNHTYGTKGWVMEGGDMTFTGNTWGSGLQTNVYDIAILSLAPSTAYLDIVAMSNANNEAVIEDQRVSPAVLSIAYANASTSYSSDLGGKFHPYSTIAPAIARVVAGGKIYVAAGTYKGNLIAYKAGLTIQSTDGAAVTIIDASQVDKSTYKNAWGKGINYSWAETNDPGLLKNGFLIWSDGVTIDGFKIINAYWPTAYNRGIGVLVGSIHTTYAGFIPWNIDEWGGIKSPAAEPKPTGVVVKNNTIDGSSDGIYNWASNGNRFENNSIINSSGLGGTAITLYEGGTDNIVKSNIIDNCKDAIVVAGAWPDVNLNVSGTLVTENEVTNSISGIKFYNVAGSDVRATSNLLANNGSGFIYDSKTTGVVKAYSNSIINNTLGANNVSPDYPFDATCNWWGSTDPATIASKINGPVIPVPWLTEGDDKEPGTPGFQPSVACSECNGVTVSISVASAAFCSGITITAVPSPAGVYTYSWTGDGTTASKVLTNADPDGDYQVTATKDNGCTATATYNFAKQNSLSSYVILGLKDVKLGENNIVTGSVGNTAAGKKVSIRKNSTVGGFVKASVIDLGEHVVVTGGQFTSPAEVELPVMQLNTAPVPKGNFAVPDNATATVTGNYNNLTIGKNATVTVAGTIYGKIVVKEGALVTFTAPVIDMNNLDADAGKANSGKYTRMNFIGATVRVKDKVAIGDRNRVNGSNTTFYMGDLTPSAEKFGVKGNDTKVTANVYMPHGKLNVQGKSGLCIMTGKYIAEEIESDNTVTWIGYDCAPGPALSYGEGGQGAAPVLEIQTETEATSVPEIPTAFSLGQNYPNPFNPATTIQFALPTASFTTLKIFNLQGQEVAALVNAAKNAGTHTVTWNAAGLPSGVYFYQLRAGSFSETKRLILQK